MYQTIVRNEASAEYFVKKFSYDTSIFAHLEFDAGATKSLT